MRVSLCLGPVTLAIALLLPASAAAQVFRGHVVDASSGVAIEGASVSVLDVTVDTIVAGTTSSRDGLFTVHVGMPGEYRLRAEHIAFGTLTTSARRLEQDAVTTVRLELRQETVELEPLRVEAERLEPPYMRDVRYRIQQDWGEFLTREEIDGLMGRDLSQLLLEIPGVQVRRDGNGTWRALTGRGSISRSSDCVAAIYVNGSRWYPMLSRVPDSTGVGIPDPVERERLNDFFTTRAADIEAVEVYRGAAEVPEAYAGYFGGCGVVAIWLRAGGSGRAERAEPIIRQAPPATYLMLSVGSQSLGGDAPDVSGITWDIGIGWLLGEPGQVSANFRYSSHDGAEIGDFVRTYSVGVEPRYYILRGGLRPYVGVRGSWTYRDLRREQNLLGPDIVDQDFTSDGWGYGAFGGVSWRVGGGIFLEGAGFWERTTFDVWRRKVDFLEGTSGTWQGVGFRLGLSYLAIH